MSKIDPALKELSMALCSEIQYIHFSLANNYVVKIKFQILYSKDIGIWLISSSVCVCWKDT